MLKQHIVSFSYCFRFFVNTMKGGIWKCTVGELKKMLSNFDDDMAVSFGSLDFSRLKQRVPDVVQLEFNQAVYKDKQGFV